MSHLSCHNVLFTNNAALDAGNKPRHHEIVSFQTLVRLELLLGIEAGFKDQITQQIRLFYWRETLRAEMFVGNSNGIYSNNSDFLKISSFYISIKAFAIIRYYRYLTTKFINITTKFVNGRNKFILSKLHCTLLAMAYVNTLKKPAKGRQHGGCPNMETSLTSRANQEFVRITRFSQPRAIPIGYFDASCQQAVK